MNATLELPAIGLGCAFLGDPALPEATAIATLEYAFERGVRLFDCAALYGGGLAEARLGKAFASCLPDIQVSTKLGRYRAWAMPPPRISGLADVHDFSRETTLRAVDEATKRLGRAPDAVLLHDCDHHMRPALDEALPALQDLKAQGIIRAVGAGCNEIAPLAQMMAEASPDVLLVAGRWTLLDRSAGSDLLPECARRGVAVMAGGVLNSGILATGPIPQAQVAYRPATSDEIEKTQALLQICWQYGVTLTDAAYAFPQRHYAVTTSLMGATTAGQIDSSLNALAARLPEAFWRALGAIEKAAS